MTTQNLIRVRWTTRSDMPKLMEIEDSKDLYRWNEKDFITTLGQPQSFGKMAILENKIIGHIIYKFNRDHCEILNIVVDLDYRRISVASRFINDLKKKSKKIKARVDETNLTAQLFLKSHSFKVIKTDNHYYENGDDSYLFFYD